MESEDEALMSHPTEPPTHDYGYAHGEPYGQPPATPTNGKATASLVTGLASLVMSWCCGLGVAGVAAIILGVKARNEIKAGGSVQKGDGMALGGIVTGAIAVVLGVLILVLIIVALASSPHFHGHETAGGTPF